MIELLCHRKVQYLFHLMNPTTIGFHSTVPVFCSCIGSFIAIKDLVNSSEALDRSMKDLTHFYDQILFFQCLTSIRHCLS